MYNKVFWGFLYLLCKEVSQFKCFILAKKKLTLVNISYETLCIMLVFSASFCDNKSQFVLHSHCSGLMMTTTYFQQQVPWLIPPLQVQLYQQSASQRWVRTLWFTVWWNTLPRTTTRKLCWRVYLDFCLILHCHQSAEMSSGRYCIHISHFKRNE